MRGAKNREMGGAEEKWKMQGEKRGCSDTRGKETQRRGQSHESGG